MGDAHVLVDEDTPPGAPVAERCHVADASDNSETVDEENSRSETPETDGNEDVRKEYALYDRDNLQHMVGLHTRRLRLRHQSETAIPVRIPSDAEGILVCRCSLQMKPADMENSVPTAYTVEDPHHLNEWESFILAVLTSHYCIRTVNLRISAVSERRGFFYQGFRLERGYADICVEVAAFADVYQDFMVPFLRHLCRVIAGQLTDIQVHDIYPHNVNDHYLHTIVEEFLLCAPIHFKDIRFARIIEATMDIRNLEVFRIYLDETDPGPRVLHALGLDLTLRGSDELWRRRYDADLYCTQFLLCIPPTWDDFGQAVDKTVFPSVCARRELIGSTCDLVPCVAQITRQIFDHLINVFFIVSARNYDESG